jgi:amidase
LGYIVPPPGSSPSDADVVFMRAVAAMKAAGAEIVPITDFTPPLPVQGTNEQLVLNYDLKNDLNIYLAGLPHPVGVKTLSDIIAFNRATPRETVLFGQDLFEQADATPGLSDLAYIKARDDLRHGSRETLDKLLAGNRLDALIRDTDDPSFRVDIVKGDNDSSNSPSLPATAGYPHLTVPMGYVQGLPVGISFIGTAWSEKTLLQLGYAYEQISHARKAPQFIPSLESAPEVEQAFAPR